MGEVAFITGIWRVGPFALIIYQRVLRHLKRSVRYGERDIEKEGFILIVSNKLEGLVCYKVV